MELKEDDDKKKPAPFQRGRRSRRSAYAFSHAQGYADLIASGQSFRRRPRAHGGPQESIREIPRREAENIWRGGSESETEQNCSRGSFKYLGVQRALSYSIAV